MTSKSSAFVWRTVLEIEVLLPKEKSSCDKLVSQQSDHYLGSSSATNHTFPSQAKENKSQKMPLYVSHPTSYKDDPWSFMGLSCHKDMDGRRYFTMNPSARWCLFSQVVLSTVCSNICNYCLNHHSEIVASKPSSALCTETERAAREKWVS